MAGFELDTDEVGAMARTLHAAPTAPSTSGTAPAASFFADLAAAADGFTRSWTTGVGAMSEDVFRLADSVEQAVLGYLASDQQAAAAFGG